MIGSWALSQKSKDNIEKRVGMPYDDIVSSDWEVIDSCIEKKIGKKLTLKKLDDGLVGRGSAYIARDRFLYIADTDRKLAAI